MKKTLTILLLIILPFTGFTQEKQVYESITYINDVSVSEIPRFVELFKKFTDMSMGENRTMTGEWVFRHWYGSGHTFTIASQYNSMEDYLVDSDLANDNIRAKIKATTGKKEQEALMAEWSELAAFWNNHTDEIRIANATTGFYYKEDVNFDVPFVMSVGRYNSSGDWADMGNAFFDWAIAPDVDSGASIAGGVSYHYMGSGPDVEVWSCYNSLVDFATAVTADRTDTDKSKAGRTAFWSLADGAHEDQIYLHIGHVDMDKGVFDLAGADR
ncbi:MAG: hypothetical protein HN507_07850 [Flavobacteriaceae bacterium]|jgi:hypothetical protein|nr:hypothetical protein [Flavobacteriaceae bacterium]